jgi:UDP-N-acetylmuramate--alanine ligase
VRVVSGPEDIAPMIANVAEDGDFVVFLGAGNITAWAHALPDELAKLK